MGIYQVERQDGVQVRLRDLAPDHLFQAICQSGYCGTAGELWYARVLSPPAHGAHHVVLTSPYVLIAPDSRRPSSVSITDFALLLLIQPADGIPITPSAKACSRA